MTSYHKAAHYENPYPFVIPTYIPPMILDRSGLPLYVPSTCKLVKSLSKRVHYADDPWNSAKCYKPDPTNVAQPPTCRANAERRSEAPSCKLRRAQPSSPLTNCQVNVVRNCIPSPQNSNQHSQTTPLTAPPFITLSFTAGTLHTEYKQLERESPMSNTYSNPPAVTTEPITLPPTQPLRLPPKRTSPILPRGPSHVGMGSSATSTGSMLFTSGLFTADRSHSSPPIAQPTRTSSGHSRSSSDGYERRTAPPTNSISRRRYSDQARLPLQIPPSPPSQLASPHPKSSAKTVLPNQFLFPSRSNTVKTCWSQPSEEDEPSFYPGMKTPTMNIDEHSDGLDWEAVNGLLVKSRDARRSIDSDFTDDSSVKLGFVASAEPSLHRSFTVHSECFSADTESESFHIDMEEIRRREAEQERDWEESQMREVTELVLKRLARKQILDAA